LTPKPLFLSQKTGVFDPNLFQNFFHKIFTNLEKPGVSKKFLNFENGTIPKLAKMKNSENSVFRGPYHEYHALMVI